MNTPDEREAPPALGEIAPLPAKVAATEPGPDLAPDLDRRTGEALVAARNAYYAAAAHAVFPLQNGQRLTSQELFDAAQAQALRAWWDLVDEEMTAKRLSADHALRRVRSWTRHYLTGEPAARQPGTLFNHALAHASRAAARQFLKASGELLTEHITQNEHPSAYRPGSPDDPEGPGEPVPSTASAAPR